MAENWPSLAVMRPQVSVTSIKNEDERRNAISSCSGYIKSLMRAESCRNKKKKQTELSKQENICTSDHVLFTVEEQQGYNRDNKTMTKEISTKSQQSPK